MSSMTTPHLTDDQFTECLVSAPSAASRLHLEQCEACRQELAAFHSSVSDFGRATTAWSEALPRPRLQAIAKSKTRWAISVPVGWALAATVLLLIGTPVWTHHHVSSAANNSAALSNPDDSAAQIAQDNQLLQSVYVALAPQDPSPFKEYGVTDRTSSQNKAPMEARNK